MNHSPVLMQAVVEARIDELRQTAVAAPRTRGKYGEHRVAEGIRRRAGWLLVGMGLRLAMPGAAAHGPAARGRR